MAAGWARFAHRFGQYYQHAPLWSPPRIKTREWMFIPFGGAPPLRHKSFSTVAQVQSFLSQRACIHASIPQRIGVALMS